MTLPRGTIPGVLAGFAALTVVLLALLTRDGWFTAIAFWQISVFGIVMIVLAIWRGRRWWLLAFLPVFLVPLGWGALLLHACSQGTCL